MLRALTLAIAAGAVLLSAQTPPVPQSTFRVTVTAFLRVTQGGSTPPAPVGVAATIRNEKNDIDFARAAP
jgi:hypothetical protein